MKTIGLIGGTTGYSSIDYYRHINELVNKKLGGDESAKVILNSVNNGEIKELTLKNDWKSIANIICAVPDNDRMEKINSSMMNWAEEIILPSTKQLCITVIDELIQEGAQGVISGLLRAFL
jgi:aspartate/glutamate racemase